MKKINLQIIFIFITSVFIIGCDDNIPRDRPTFNNNLASTTTTENEKETEVETKGIERPEGAIIIKSNHCACNSSREPISFGNCTEICQSKASGISTDTLFFETEVTAAISESNLQDVAGFCTTQANESDTQVASCYIEVKDQSGNLLAPLPFEPTSGKNDFSVAVNNLSKDVTYRLAIVESASGARSTSFQLRMADDILEDNVGGPLALMPVNQYACVFRTSKFDQNTGELIIEDVNRFHFYFTAETRPEPLKPSSLPSVYCYDIETHGNTPINSPLLEETTNSFTVWNKNDPRFYVFDPSGEKRVHELIKQELELQGQTVTETPKLFYPFQWPSGIDDGDTSIGGDSDSAPSTISSTVGYYMTPFLDTDTYKAYCPTRAHYQSSNPLFKALKDIVAIDTEGLYAAKQDNVCDFILVKESLVKKIWFYKEGGQHIQPTDTTIVGKKIQFYWPADESSPYLKKNHQRIYTIKASSDISCGGSSSTDNGGSDSSGNTTAYPPHDKRIGCIPKLVE